MGDARSAVVDRRSAIGSLRFAMGDGRSAMGDRRSSFVALFVACLLLACDFSPLARHSVERSADLSALRFVLKEISQLDARRKSSEIFNKSSEKSSEHLQSSELI